jgi:hypothetical protein
MIIQSTCIIIIEPDDLKKAEPGRSRILKPPTGYKYSFPIFAIYIKGITKYKLKVSEIYPELIKIKKANNTKLIYEIKT